MHIINLDLNLLIVAESLFRHLNVSKTAHELGLSQSAISHALNRLRAHYNDPLFVRISKGIAPTKFAISIRKDIELFLVKANKLAQKQEKFDPKKTKARITIATTDYFETVVMPLLIPKIQAEAPGLIISLRPTLGALPKKELEENHFDLAIAGFYKNLPEGFYKINLFKDHFETALNKEFPLKNGKIDKELFFKSEHALITLQGDFEDNLYNVVGGKKHFRKITYGSFSFTGPAWVISSAKLVLTGPSLLLKRYADFFPLKIVECPVKIDPIEIQMVWHEQTHQDPLGKWFRELIRQTCAAL